MTIIINSINTSPRSCTGHTPWSAHGRRAALTGREHIVRFGPRQLSLQVKTDLQG